MDYVYYACDSSWVNYRYYRVYDHNWFYSIKSAYFITFRIIKIN